MKFSYQSEKFSEARSALMLPHPRGESESIASAFHACSLGMRDLNVNTIDSDARDWIVKIERLMDTSGLSNQDERGLWAVKADTFTEEQKWELSSCVNGLASYFCREFWGTDTD
jgi:hypothetical protein